MIWVNKFTGWNVYWFLGCKQIKVLDIGGGVPNNYHGEDDSVDFAKYKTDVLGTVHT